MSTATPRRTLRLLCLPALVAGALAASGLAACDPGSYDEGPVDAAPPPPEPDAAPAPDAAATCDPQATTIPDGRHNPGLPCQGCHYAGAVNAPAFTFAGTLYNSVSGGQGVAGATIHVKDANGVEDTIITGTFGNFYSKKVYAYPIKVSASSCPDTLPMFSDVTSPGDCNSSGCHSPDAPSGRAHLP